MRSSCSFLLPFFMVFFFVGCSGDEIDVGAQAPDFKLKNQDGETISLSKYRGQNVVIFFFGRTNNEETAKHVKAFDNEKSIYGDADAVIIGISNQREEILRNFSRTQHLTYDILSDPELKAIEPYNAGGTMGTKRVSYVIDREGIIKFIVDARDVDDHHQELHEALKTLQ